MACIHVSISLESVEGNSDMTDYSELSAPEARTQTRKVLLVDDDPQLCIMLAEYLHREGFRVTSVHDGQAGVDAVAEGGYDVVVMDITMPVMDGFEALRRIRTTSEVPVVMLTARGDEVDRIVGLEIGADDYLPKPFNPRELAARLRAVLRRTHISPTGNDDTGPVEQGDIRIEPGSRRLWKKGEPVPVTATEFVIVELLMRSAGQLVTKDELMEKGLGRRLTPYDRSLDTHIANLRRKLGTADDDSPMIKTVRGQGYIFVTR
jgi:two-component system response regulator CpxR